MSNVNYGKWHNKVITYESSCDDEQVAVHYTSMGCYPLMYLMSGCALMCPDCALSLERQWEREGVKEPVIAFAHYEGQLSCEECGATVDGAYYEEDMNKKESESDSD